ncbi:Interactor of constitutive active ROPs 4 [Camellia lanceoleosa]|uniref:Interactor of constitutive active ROPs 4 n=1 Tax=Camellia lanceoleosa TaxID=1840588 RepID=A0ACC0G681_9ERIC|nr:Interactor of constitutive active ROPs 4 [Camellia lanceoleosa]
MKKPRMQTEQWRKAADATAATLARGVEKNGRRISERCGSIEKPLGAIFEPPVDGYMGFVGSPGLGDDSNDDFGNGKRKGSFAVRMFRDYGRRRGKNDNLSLLMGLQKSLSLLMLMLFFSREMIVFVLGWHCVYIV